MSRLSIPGGRPWRASTALALALALAAARGLPARAADEPKEQDRADRAADVGGAPEPDGRGAEAAGLADRARSADLVADVTLAKGVTYTAAGERVLRTSYVFKVNEAIAGEPDGEFVVVNDTGGAYADGSTVSTENSFRLSPGGRYLILADRVGDDLWLREVLQVHGDGAVTADAAGRVVVGMREGSPIVRAVPTFGSLRYVRPLPPPVERMEGDPQSPEPLPGRQEAAAPDAAALAAVDAGSMLGYLKAARAGEARPADLAPRRRPENAPPEPAAPAPPRPANIEGRSQETAREAILSGNHMTTFQSHFHFMPNDNNWAWTAHSRGTWNALVGNNLGLFAYKIRTSDGQPIRDRAPVANNGEFNVGVLSDAQMTAGGYSTWAVLGANGVCYTWTSGNRVRETDILINPSIAGDEAQFRKSLSHEYGHAATLQHEERRFALMYPGTFRQPPNYASLWYSRRDDHTGVWAMLEWVNANVAANTWNITQFTDMAAYSQAHANPGTTGNLVMTRLSTETIPRGGTATLRSLHVENRGRAAASNVRLKVYLSTNEQITTSDIEIGSLTWSTFSTWWSGDMSVRVPSTVAPGQYFVGWIVSTDTPELSSANNTAIMVRDNSSAFARVRIRVN